MPKPDLDLLLDAVGFVAPDGSISPENSAMVALLSRLRHLELPANLLLLPIDEADLQELRRFMRDGSGVEERSLVVSAPGQRLFLRTRLQAVGERSGHWLVLRDQTVEREVQARVGRLERVRQLGQIGEGIVHDLNNLMGAVMGLADHMSEETGDAELRGFLREMVQGTQQRAQILQALHRILHQNRRGAERISLAAVLGDSIEVFAKTALHQGRELHSEVGAATPEVRVLAEDVMHVCLYLLNRALREADGTIEVRVGPAAWPGQPQRACGRVRFIDAGEPGRARELQAFLNQERPGLGAVGQYRIDDDLLGLFSAMVRLRLHGATLEVETLPDGRCCWSLFLPAAGQRA